MRTFLLVIGNISLYCKPYILGFHFRLRKNHKGRKIYELDLQVSISVAVTSIILLCIDIRSKPVIKFNSCLRQLISSLNLFIMYRLIAICEDINAARSEGELGVEEILYWTLVKIYRSPHMLLEYTKVD